MRKIYKGRKVTINKPRRIRPGQTSYGRKKFEVYVIDGSRVKRVTFGQPGMTIKKHIPARQTAFLKRHKCATAKDKTTPRYWSCMAWK